MLLAPGFAGIPDMHGNFGINVLWPVALKNPDAPPARYFRMENVQESALRSGFFSSNYPGNATWRG
jgi:hypothetical protein